MKIIKKLWKNCFNYKGTADPKEFFSSIFANIVAMYVIFIPFALLLAGVLYALDAMGVELSEVMSVIVLIVAGVYLLIFTLPICSLIVRRMRDSQISIWILILILFGVPVAGFVIIGLIKKSEFKQCLLSKVGYILFLGGFGFALWLANVGFLSSDMSFLEQFGMYGIMSMVFGLIIAYIGVKIDERRYKSNAYK